MDAVRSPASSSTLVANVHLRVWGVSPSNVSEVRILSRAPNKYPPTCSDAEMGGYFTFIFSRFVAPLELHGLANAYRDSQCGSGDQRHQIPPLCLVLLHHHL